MAGKGESVGDDMRHCLLVPPCEVEYSGGSLQIVVLRKIYLQLQGVMYLQLRVVIYS